MKPAQVVLSNISAWGTRGALDSPSADERDACLEGIAALDRLAQTCATCQHANTIGLIDGWVYCAAPREGIAGETLWGTSRYPFKYRTIPADERCKGWTKREDA